MYAYPQCAERMQFTPSHWCKAVDSNCSYYQPNMADTEKGKIDFLLYLIRCCTFQNITYERINPPT